MMELAPISLKLAERLLEYVQIESDAGKPWVVYPKDFPLTGTWDLEYFDSEAEALKHVDKYSEEYDRLEAVSAKEMQSRIYRAISLNGVDYLNKTSNQTNNSSEEVKRLGRR